MLNPRLSKIMREGNKAQRRYICDRPEGFPYFCLYYFPDYFNYPMADFHFEMHEDLEKLARGDIQFLVWMLFRESAKTTIAKMYACWCAVTGRKHYINFDSFEKANAEAALFDIAVWLQTNKRLVADYGQLYFEPRKEKKSTMKRIGSFVLANDVKFEAFSTQESSRGRIYKQYRPDLVVGDDFETFKTKKSSKVTQNIRDHFDEFIAGLPEGASMLFLCNYITESGNVQYLLEKAKVDPKFLVRRVDAEKDGEPAWPQKHVMTDDEANALNAGIEDKRKRVVSLESKRRTLNAGGRKVYEVEMLNSPEAAGDMVFDRTIIDRLIQSAKAPQKEIGGFKMWDEFEPMGRYAIGGDTSQGVGRDSSASVCINFTPIPAKLVASYANNRIAPDVFAHEMKRQGELYGQCLLAPEVNNQGWATVQELKHIYPVEKIYRQTQTGKQATVDDRLTIRMGWDTNGATKSSMIYNLKTAVEQGWLVIEDKALLEEMRRYNQTDLGDTLYDAEATRHFDLLIAAAIAWAMKDFAVLGKAAEDHHRVEQERRAREEVIDEGLEFERPTNRREKMEFEE